jgi:hypothetical protein
MEAMLSVFADLVPTIGLQRIRRFPEKLAPASSMTTRDQCAPTRRDRRNKPPDEPGPVK